MYANRYYYLPLRVVATNGVASCAPSDGCTVRVDIHNTPNISSVRTPLVRAGSVIHLHGRNIQTGLRGQYITSAKLRTALSADEPAAAISCATASETGRSLGTEWYYRAACELAGGDEMGAPGGELPQCPHAVSSRPSRHHLAPLLPFSPSHHHMSP